MITVLCRGEHFGEMALLFAQRRYATARAVTYTLLFSLHQDDLREILTMYPHVKCALVKEAERRREQMQERNRGTSAATTALASIADDPALDVATPPRSPMSLIHRSRSDIFLQDDGGGGGATADSSDASPAIVAAAAAAWASSGSGSDDGGGGGGGSVSRREIDEFRDEMRGMISALQDSVKQLAEREASTPPTTRSWTSSRGLNGQG